MKKNYLIFMLLLLLNFSCNLIPEVISPTESPNLNTNQNIHKSISYDKIYQNFGILNVSAGKVIENIKGRKVNAEVV